MEWMYPQDGSGNVGPPDRSCHHRGVYTEAQRAEAVLDRFLLDVGGDRLALRGPCSLSHNYGRAENKLECRS